MSAPRWRLLNETNAVAAFPGVTRRTLVSGDHLTLVRIELEQGATVPQHVHPHEQAGTVISGRIRLSMPRGSGPRDLGPGASYLIPGDLPHEVTALTDAVVAEVFSPVRREFASD